MYKRYLKLIIIFAAALALIACSDVSEKPSPSPDVVTSASKSENNEAKDQVELLNKAWSFIDEYNGNGKLSSIKELSLGSQTSITIKYDNASEEDILSYAKGIGFTADWVPPTSEGGTYFITEKLKDNLTLSIWYLKADSEDNFEMVLDIQ